MKLLFILSYSWLVCQWKVVASYYFSDRFIVWKCSYLLEKRQSLENVKVWVHFENKWHCFSVLLPSTLYCFLISANVSGLAFHKKNILFLRHNNFQTGSSIAHMCGFYICIVFDVLISGIKTQHQNSSYHRYYYYYCSAWSLAESLLIHWRVNTLLQQCVNWRINNRAERDTRDMWHWPDGTNDDRNVSLDCLRWWYHNKPEWRANWQTRTTHARWHKYIHKHPVLIRTQTWDPARCFSWYFWWINIPLYIIIIFFSQPNDRCYE